MAFWELSVFEVVTEAFIADSYWTRRPLLVLKGLKPLNLLFLFDFILLFLTCPALLCKQVRIHDALFLHRYRD